MKNILKKTFIVLVAVNFLACSDLEENPTGVLAPEGFFKSTTDVETAIFGAYGWIASERLWGRQFVTAIMLRSDMVDIGDLGTPAERQQVNNFTMDDGNGMVRQFWPYWYQVISAANSAIAGAESLGLPEEQINPLIAEARFIRAFAYYHLAMNFSYNTYIDLFITDPAMVEQLSTKTKPPEEEVCAKGLDVLRFAKEWLPDQRPGDVRTRPTKRTAAAYLADVSLVLHNYDNA